MGILLAGLLVVIMGSSTITKSVGLMIEGVGVGTVFSGLTESSSGSQRVRETACQCPKLGDSQTPQSQGDTDTTNVEYRGPEHPSRRLADDSGHIPSVVFVWSAGFIALSILNIILHDATLPNRAPPAVAGPSPKGYPANRGKE